MHVTLKTLQQQTFKIEIDQEESVSLVAAVLLTFCLEEWVG